jgi:RNA polymerase sigma-70 factor (ECF subfamily)
VTISERPDELSFQQIHDIFRPKILRYLRRLVGGQDADDLTQDVFVKVSQALDTFRGNAMVSTWIYRIATNAALDRLRSRSFQGSVSDSPTGNDEEEVVDKDLWTGEKKLSLESALIRKEMNDCIRGIVENLPVNYRTVIVLSEWEGLKNNEITEILGLSLDTVKIRLHRARARLKKELEQHCSFYRDERNELSCDRKTTPLKFLKK